MLAGRPIAEQGGRARAVMRALALTANAIAQGRTVPEEAHRLVRTLPIPASLDRVVMACLAKKPEDRPSTAEALARMLEECKDVGAWTQDDAEKWWLTNQPGFVTKRADDTQPGDSVSAAALPTM